MQENNTQSAYVESIDHINIVVHDIDKMAQFYSDVVGLEIYKKIVLQGEWIDKVVGLTNVLADVVFLKGKNGGTNLELIQYRTPQGENVEHLSVPNTYGIRHIAFKTNDIDIMVERFKKLNINIGDVQEVPSTITFQNASKKRLCYFYDPEGNLLEFCDYK